MKRTIYFAILAVVAAIAFGLTFYFMAKTRCVYLIGYLAVCAGAVIVGLVGLMEGTETEEHIVKFFDTEDEL